MYPKGNEHTGTSYRLVHISKGIEYIGTVEEVEREIETKVTSR